MLPGRKVYAHENRDLLAVARRPLLGSGDR